MDSTRRLPPALVEHARDFLAGDRTPVVPKGAATVVLLSFPIMLCAVQLCGLPGWTSGYA